MNWNHNKLLNFHLEWLTCWCYCLRKPQKFIFHMTGGDSKSSFNTCWPTGELSKEWFYRGQAFVDWDTDLVLQYMSEQCVCHVINANHSIWSHSSVPAADGIQNRRKLQSLSMSQSVENKEENPSHSTWGEVNKKKFVFSAKPSLVCPAKEDSVHHELQNRERYGWVWGETKRSKEQTSSSSADWYVFMILTCVQYITTLAIQATETTPQSLLYWLWIIINTFLVLN